MKHQIEGYLHHINDGSILELYKNDLSNAVLIIIYPSSIEHHIDMDISIFQEKDFLFLENIGVYIMEKEQEQEPIDDITCPFLNTNLYDEILNDDWFEDDFFAY